MSVKIRLKRMGAKKKPFYRIVVADSRSPRDGRFIEEIGYYDPMKEPSVISVDQVKALDWIKKGAQATETVRALLKKAGVFNKPEAAGEEQ
jgi:small subunit ribosomal protein S16